MKTGLKQKAVFAAAKMVLLIAGHGANDLTAAKLFDR